MREFIVFSNNPATANFYNHHHMNDNLRWVAANTMEVLSATKAAILKGAVLKSDPLSGFKMQTTIFSAKPTIVNPLLSLAVIQKPGQVDFNSVKTIEAAMTEFKKNARLRFKSHNDDAMNNFQMMDLEILVKVLGVK